MNEVRTKSGRPIWERTENGQNKGLVITQKGLTALGIEPDAKAVKPPHTKKTSARPSRTKRKEAKATAFTARAKTKKAQLVTLLMTAEGAGIDQLTKKFCWQAHTVRAALTGLRKSGYDIERDAIEGISRYRIVGTRKAA